MDHWNLIEQELKGSFRFFYDYTNRNPKSKGYGLTADSSKRPEVASIAATGFALSAWVIADRKAWLSREEALALVRGTLNTLLCNVSQYKGFFAHFITMDEGMRMRKCEYSTIDTALCLNGVITVENYFKDKEITEMADRILKRVEWDFIVYEFEGNAMFHMAFNPDKGGDYVIGKPGFIYHWDMAAEQKMMYFLASNQLDEPLARALYKGFRRDRRSYLDQDIIINPGGNLFCYQFFECWFDSASFLDPDGIDWFENSKLATLANRDFCIRNSDRFKSYGPNSWGLSAGDGPKGYVVSGAEPSENKPYHNGTISIYSAIASIVFTPELSIEMMNDRYSKHPQTWGKYGFFDAYNLDVNPPWFSRHIIGIDKGCSMLMLENYLSGSIWDIYCTSPYIQHALGVLGFTRRERDIR